MNFPSLSRKYAAQHPRERSASFDSVEVKTTAQSPLSQGRLNVPMLREARCQPDQRPRLAELLIPTDGLYSLANLQVLCLGQMWEDYLFRSGSFIKSCDSMVEDNNVCRLAEVEKLMRGCLQLRSHISSATLPLRSACSYCRAVG